MTAVMGIVTVVSFASCRPSRVYANKEKDRDRQEERYRDETRYRNVDPPPSPRQRSSYSTSSLLISPSPGFVMQRNPDGRYYHRSRYGMLYWKGYDDRFFLDRAFLNRVRFNQWEYNEWKQYARNSGRRY